MEVDLHQENHFQDHHHQDQHKKLKCVCQLCNCGKHHCPRPRVKGNFSTSYADNYKNISFAPSSPPRPQYKYQQRHYNPDVMTTSYQQNYKDQPVNYINPQSPSKFQNAGSKIVGKVPFIGESSYKDQFKGFVVKPPVVEPYQRQVKAESLPPQYPRSPVKFEGVTSYKTQFQEPPKVESRPPPEQTYKKINIPFAGESSYKNQYPEYKLEPMSFKSEELMSSPRKPPAVKFEGHTSYHDQFKGYTIDLPKQVPADHQCYVEKIHVPPMNYINQKNHIFYDPETKTFV